MPRANVMDLAAEEFIFINRGCIVNMIHVMLTMGRPPQSVLTIIAHPEMVGTTFVVKSPPSAMK